MATEIRVKKEELMQITNNIDQKLYTQLIDVMSISMEARQKFDTADLYFIDQLLHGKLRPWYIAICLRNLEFTSLAEHFEAFATKYKFSQEESNQTDIPQNPKIATMQLLKKLYSELLNKELLKLRDSTSESFENIFNDMLYDNIFTPTVSVLEESYGKLSMYSNLKKGDRVVDLRDLKCKLQFIDREDLATIVILHSEIISTLDPVTFKRTVRLCLDTINVDIYSILTDLKAALKYEHSNFHTLDEDQHTSSLQNDYIPLTFTSEVDTRTLPLTEGSDAELKTLFTNYEMQIQNKAPYYIDVQEQIYSTSLDKKLICLIGHPGTGKTLFCRKLINLFATGEDDIYRFVLLIACRDGRWHSLEDSTQNNAQLMTDNLEQLAHHTFPYFSQSHSLAQIILKTNGRGVLLIIDSFDEFPQHYNFNATLLYQILVRRFLPECTLLLTSRPGAWNKLTRSHGGFLNIYKSWQVLGFSVDQRNEFIQRMLSSPTKVKECFEFLTTRLELNILSLVPINISLITALIKNTDSVQHIHTLTDLYTSLIIFTLDRQLKRVDTNSQGIPNLYEMNKDMLIEFKMLTDLSYHALLKRQITFSLGWFPNIQTSGSKYTIGLGLFHIIRVKTAHQTCIDYLSCPHLTFQEYLSAWYLCSKTMEELTVIIQQIFMEEKWPAMKVCIRFLLGLITQTNKSTDDLIHIITFNLHRQPVPLLDCKYALVENSQYNELHKSNTTTHLSVLPYVAETKHESTIVSYYNLLTPSNSTAPHFYLTNTIPPIDVYNLYQFLTVLPPTFTVSMLYIDITQHDRLQLNMLQKTINCIPINNLIVKFKHISNLLSNLINNISSKDSIHIPKNIYYYFDEVTFMDDLMTNQFISNISPTATYIIFKRCNITLQIMSHYVALLPRLEYLHINFDGSILDNEIFQNLRRLKGLYLSYVKLTNHLELYEYLKSNTSLQEIHLEHTTYSTPDTLQSLLHLTSLRYIYIAAEDKAFVQQNSNTPLSLPLFIIILENNIHALSYIELFYYTESHYNTIMNILRKCKNLQYIDVNTCNLTSHHMATLGDTINQLSGLVYINMSSNVGFRDQGLKTLSEVLDIRTNLRCIRICLCNLTTSTAIFSLMKKFPNLQELDVRDNKFNDTNKEKLKQLAKQKKIDLHI